LRLSSDSEQRDRIFGVRRKDPTDKGKVGKLSVRFLYFGLVWQVNMGSAISTLAGVGMAIGYDNIIVLSLINADASTALL